MFYLTLVSLTLAANVQDIEFPARQLRRTISSCHIVLKLTGFVAATEERIEYNRAIEVWMDGDKLRVDATITEKNPAPGLPAVRRKIMCRNCVEAGHSTSYTHRWGAVKTVPTRRLQIGRGVSGNV